MIQLATRVTMIFLGLLTINGTIALTRLIDKDGIQTLTAYMTICSLSVTILLGACIGIAQIADTPDEKQKWKRLSKQFLYMVVVILWGNLTVLIGIYGLDFAKTPLIILGAFLISIASLLAIFLTAQLMFELGKSTD